jgi:hypothetical protein
LPNLALLASEDLAILRERKEDGAKAEDLVIFREREEAGTEAVDR